MNKLTRKINQSRIAILRKQLKRASHMEYDIRKTWTPVYEERKQGEKPQIIAYEKYTPVALRVFRREYWNTNGYGGVQFLDSVKVMRDLANRGDKWLLKAFNKVFYDFEGYRHGMIIIDMWKHSDRDGLLKTLHPLVHQVDMTRLTEKNLPTYKRQRIFGEAFFPTMVVGGDVVHEFPQRGKHRFSGSEDPAVREIADCGYYGTPVIRDVHMADYANSKPNLHGEGTYKPFPPLPENDGLILVHDPVEVSITGPAPYFSTSMHSHPNNGKIIAQGSFDRLQHGDKGVIVEIDPNRKPDDLTGAEVETIMSQSSIYLRVGAEGQRELAQQAALKLLIDSSDKAWKEFLASASTEKLPEALELIKKQIEESKLFTYDGPTKVEVLPLSEADMTQGFGWTVQVTTRPDSQEHYDRLLAAGFGPTDRTTDCRLTDVDAAALGIISRRELGLIVPGSHTDEVCKQLFDKDDQPNNGMDAVARLYDIASSSGRLAIMQAKSAIHHLP